MFFKITYQNAKTNKDSSIFVDELNAYNVKIKENQYFYNNRFGSHKIIKISKVLNDKYYKFYRDFEKEFDSLSDSPVLSWVIIIGLGILCYLFFSVIGLTNNDTNSILFGWLSFFMGLFGPALILWSLPCFIITEEIPIQNISKLLQNKSRSNITQNNVASYFNSTSTTNTTSAPQRKTLEESYTEHKESLVRKLTSDNSEKAKSNPTVRKAIDEIAEMNMKADLSWVKESGATQEQQDEIANNLEIQEQKKLANHVAYEGRISATDKRKLKTILGYNCMVCGKNMKDKYGDIGNGYIELHHKIPYANMAVNDTRTLNKDDFCVLCPDCHRMIHKLKDAGDLELLKTIIAIQNPNEKVSVSEYTSQQKQEYDYFDDDDD